MVLLIDNYDSFTYNLYDYIQQLGYDCMVVRNDELNLDEIKELAFDSIIVSPGPGIPKDSGICLELINHYHDKVPILGICLGFQAIGEFFGAKLQKAIKPMHGKTSLIKINQNGRLFGGMEMEVDVMRYHSLILNQIPEKLNVLAQTSQNEVMAFQHKTLPLAGVQFHPESILTKDGIVILKNWFLSLKQD